MMERRVARKSLPLLFSALLLSSEAYANPGPNSDYANVTQASYTEDLIGAPLELANAILCHMNNIGLDTAPLDTPYIAWVEDARCTGDAANPSIAGALESQARSGDGGSRGLEQFNRGRIQVSLSADGQATVISHWELEKSGRAWAHIVYDTSQSAATNQMVAYVRIARQGDFDQLYSLVVDEETTLFRLRDNDISGNQISGAQGWSARVGSALGYGRISLDDEVWSFGYNEEFYCRSTAGEELCFDRKLSKADTSVWQYGLFDLSGNRLDVPGERGTGIRLADNPSVGGYVDYSGIWFPQESLADLKDSQTVISSAGEELELTYLRYRLDQYIQTDEIPLSRFDRRNFWIWGDFLDNGKSQDMELYWDDARKLFVVTGFDPDGDLKFRSPVEISDIESTYTLEQFFSEFPNVVESGSPQRFFGWDYLWHRGLFFEVDDVADPSSVKVLAEGRTPLNSAAIDLKEGDILLCKSGCATMATIASYEASPTKTDPFTESNVEYSVRFKPQFAILDPAGQVMSWPRVDPHFEPGENSGGRIDLYLKTNGIPSTSMTHALELGVGWDSFILRRNGEAINFAKPIELRYEPTSGDYAGRLLNLRFESGRINVPGGCIKQRDHTPVSCSVDEPTHWLHAFTIPGDPVDGRVTAIIDGVDVPALAKWVERSVFMKRVEDVTSNSEVLRMGVISDEPEVRLQDLQLLDPSDSNSEVFIGQWPSDGDFNVDPRVIHGEVIRD